MRLLIAAALAFAAPAFAQDAVKPWSGGNTNVMIVPSADVAKKLGSVPTSFTISSADKYSVLFSHRTVDGQPEQHANWIDVMVMLHGDVTFTYGGTISGGTIGADGESHGGTLAGGTTVALHEGDYLQVPAGVPHLMTAPKNDFRYFVTKVHN